MSYIEKIINNDEKLFSLSHPHWIYLFEGVIWFLLLTLIGLLADYYFYLYVGSRAVSFEMDLWLITFDEKFTPIPYIFIFTGFAIFLPLLIVYLSHEIALTDQRIIHKKGLFFVKTDQVDLEDIRAEHVSHGLLGWALGYGSIRLDCRFITDVSLPAIAKPYDLVKASHTARMWHPLIEYDQDKLNQNLKIIEVKEQNAQASKKLKKLKQAIKLTFKKAA